MPNVSAQLSVQLTDSLGVTTTMNTWHTVADTTTLADLNTWAAAYLPTVDDLSDGLIGDVSLSLKLTKPGGLKATPVDDSEVEKTALFNFTQTGLPWLYGVDVPAISADAITDGHIDLAADAVTTWLGVLLTPTNGVDGISKYFLALVALHDALITFRKHRKARARRSLSTPGA